MKLTTLLLAFALALAAQKPDAAQTALKNAIDKEVADGDLKAAIVLYNKVASTYKSNKSVAAQALVRLGQCHEKLGDAEARKAYERALREFPDEAEQAAIARTRLAALARTASESRAMTARLLLSQPGIRVNLSRVSQNGRTFPYVSIDGNVVVRDLETGVSHQITRRANPNEASFAWAPIPTRDGTRVAYSWTLTSSDYELLVAPASGGEPRVVPVKIRRDGWVNPWDWAPDGRHLLGWTFSQAPKLWNMAIVDTETGEVRSPFSPRSQRCENGSFSPDGKLIVAACYIDENVNTPPNRDIVVFDAGTGKETALLSGPADDRSPLWSSSPGKILFISNRQGKDGLWSVDNKAGATPVLVNGDLGASVLLGLAKDGTLYYGRQNTTRDVYLANLDPGTLRLQGQPMRFVDTYLGHNASPVWSPSGDSFAYVSHRDISGGSHMVIRGKQGNEVVAQDRLNWADASPSWCSERQLLVWGTPHPATRRFYDSATGAINAPDLRIQGLRAPYQLGYAPGCQSIYVSSFNRDTSRRRIFRIDLDTRKETELYTDDAEWSLAPTVSPDGRWLALVGRVVKGGPVGLLLMPTSGGAPRMLAPGSGDDSLFWAPDSNHLFYVGFQGGQQEFFAVSIDGGAPVATGIRGRGLVGPSLHPDGRQAIYSARESVAEVWSLRNFVKE